MARYVWSREEGRWVTAAAVRPPAGVVVIDRDAGFAEGIRSMADGRTYTTRRAYDEHLKRHAMVEIGNDVIVSARPEPPSALPALRRALG